MQNHLTSLMGMEIPIILAPMAGAIDTRFASAICNAGGSAILPLWNKPPEALRQEIRVMKSLTNSRFSVNLNMSFPFEEHLEACIEEQVFGVSLFWGLNKGAIDTAKNGNLKVLVSVGSADEAKEAVDAGVDIIVAQGWEAGGHVWGQVSTMALVPAVVDIVGDIPVIAAGGIADGRGIAAAFMLGASAVWIGTRFLGAAEANIHPHYQKRLLNATEAQTQWAHDLYDVGWPDAPHRALSNTTSKIWNDEGRPAPGGRADEGKIVGQKPTGEPIKNYQSYTPLPRTEGDVEAMSMWSGQGVSQLKKIQPAAEILSELWEDTERKLRQFQV